MRIGQLHGMGWDVRCLPCWVCRVRLAIDRWSVLRWGWSHRTDRKELTGLNGNGWRGTIRGMPIEGVTAERSKQVGVRDIGLFTEITGDRNPLHFDVEAARDSLFGGLIVQGGLTSGIFNSLVAEDLPGPGSVFLSVEWQFVKAVYIGDTITGRGGGHACPGRQTHLQAGHHGTRSERRDLPFWQCQNVHGSPSAVLSVMTATLAVDAASASRRQVCHTRRRLRRSLGPERRPGDARPGPGPVPVNADAVFGDGQSSPS
jgi:MaoC like domain